MGGKSTTIKHIPWQLSVRIKGRHKCGASLLTENRALSAAHCYRPTQEKVTDLTVMAGSTRRWGDVGCLIIGIDKFIQHPNFDNGTLLNGTTPTQSIQIFELFLNLNSFVDIGVIWLQRKLTFNTRISPVKVSIR